MMNLPSPTAGRSDAPAGLRFWRYFLPAFALAAAVFSLFPGLDLGVSASIYEPAKAWPLQRHPAGQILRTILNLVSWGVFAGVFVAAVIATRNPRTRLRAMAFIVLCYGIGPGLIVNGGLKQFWGRARPVQIVEFGGARSFTPALVPADQCARNCSFSSGEAALGFVAAAPALLLGGWMRWAMLGGGLALGVALSAVRILQGGHFLSDTVFSALFVWFGVWLSFMLVYGGWLAALWQRRRARAADAANPG